MTPIEMEGLLTWLNYRILNKDIHPLLIISTFVYEFLSIHPYQDGNGRLARLLTTLLLLKLDYIFIQFVSFENVIESRKEDYYKALMDGQKNRGQENERIDTWTRFFLESLITLTQRLDAKYQTYSKLELSLNTRQQAVLQVLKDLHTSQINEINFRLNHVYSRNTVKKDLAFLVTEGFLFRTGAGRGARYHIKDS
jgi:Fic family protein